MKSFKEFMNESYSYNGIIITGLPYNKEKESLLDNNFWVNKKGLSPDNIKKVVIGGVLYNTRKHMEDYNQKSTIVSIYKLQYNKDDLEGTVNIFVTLSNDDKTELRMLSDDFNKPTEWYLTRSAAEYAYSKHPIK